MKKTSRGEQRTEKRKIPGMIIGRSANCIKIHNREALIIGMSK